MWRPCLLRFTVRVCLVYVRPRSDRESALVFMVRSATVVEIRRGHIEEELREIALERDDPIRDRFDHLVGDCEILDLSISTTTSLPALGAR